MALIINDLANDLYNSLSKTTDKDGKPTYSNDYTKAYANGIISMIKATTLIGTANGTAATPGPGVGMSSDGQGPFIANVGLMTSIISSQFSQSNATTISSENNAVATYLTSNLKINFPMGNITGNGTATPSADGVFTGSGANGTIIDINGSALSSAVASALGFIGPDMTPFYTALCNYILANGIAAYSSVTGPQSGSSWTGNATGGSIV
jgi:hypothetical protein